MNDPATFPAPATASNSPDAAAPATNFGPAMMAGLFAWVAISLGFLGLHMLMQERPEFVGQPMRASKLDLLQESPRIVVRKVSDDVAVIKTASPEFSDVTISMRGRRDYRGLKTIMDMSGEVRARHVVSNSFEEPMHVLFRCPHPRTAGGGTEAPPAGALRLQSSIPGIQENARDAWVWSGTVEAHQAVTLEVSYQAASLKGVTYRVNSLAAEPMKHLRVAFQRQDLDSMRFETADGPMAAPGDQFVWERRDFLAPDLFSAGIVEGRNLHGSLLQLLEIGPIVCALFLLAAGAIILGRQALTAVQVFTIAAGYALYFPLMVYLSSRFSFPVALLIAGLVPGALLVNYARLLLGPAIGLLGGIVFLALYQVFPTLAAFAGWNRGMVLLWLGVVTFGVLIQLQNRALKQRNVTTAAAVACLGLLALAWPAGAADVQVIVPGQLVASPVETNRVAAPALLSFEPAEYQVEHEGTWFRVAATLPFQVLRPGDEPVMLFSQPVHLEEQRLESAAPEVAQLVTVSNRPGILASHPGKGVARFSYRVGLETREGQKRARVALLAGPAGNVKLDSVRADLGFATGTLWSKAARDKRTIYDVGVAGDEALIVEWREQGEAAPPAAPGTKEAVKEFYGIGIARAQHLTVINSDGSCTQFSEFELPAFHTEELRLRLPPQARLISVSVNGAETAAPVVEEQLCRVRIPSREAGQTSDRISFRMSYPPVRLGFIGAVELALPEVFQTVGTLEWIVALPSGFEAQVVSSGLEVQKSPPDLGRFGDYGRILKSHPQSSLTKDLVPPGMVQLNLRYRQIVPALDQTP